jgi:hypothetical protein
MPVFYYCKQHKYRGDIPCPDCFPIEAANQDAKKAYDDLEPPRMLYTILAGLALWVIALVIFYFFVLR